MGESPSQRLRLLPWKSYASCSILRVTEKLDATMRISLFRDYKEEGWESMEVYADNLMQSLRSLYRNLKVYEVLSYPVLSRRFAGRNKLMRYVFRFCINPLFARLHQGEVNHIIDQANAHLLAILDPKRTVITCHDLIVPYWIMHHVRPQTYKKYIKRVGELWRISFLKKAAIIIAVSQSTKEDIQSTLGISPDKIIVVPEGVDKTFTTTPSVNALRQVRSLYSLPSRYVLHVGTTHEYKNMERLINVFSLLHKHDRNLILVKAGSPWTDKQRQLLQGASLEQHVHHIGFVPKEALPAVYAGALFLIHPSHTEGFGFTPLEAMAIGCPVVVSDIPALREIVGPAGIYIGTSLSTRIDDDVLQLLRSFSRRQIYKKLGKRRAALYTWDRTARLTHAVYRSLVQSQKGRS